MLTRHILLAATMGALAIASSDATGDGFFAARYEIKELGQSETLTTSPKQEAIVATDGKMVQIILRTHFYRGSEELAWVIPVPAKPFGIAKGKEGVFAKLDELTAPRFYSIVRTSRSLPTIGCAAAQSQKSVIVQPTVRIEETGTAGIFEYTVLSATEGHDLGKWLNKNKYAVPRGAEKLFERYVKAGWYWLAMRVRPGLGDLHTLAPHPITYLYKDEKLVYPLVISQLSAAAESEIVLYVVGDTSYECGNWKNMNLTDVAGALRSERLVKNPTSPSGTNYEELFRSVTKENGWHLFVTEFSQEWSIFGHEDGRCRRIDGVLDSALIDTWRHRQTVTRLRAFVKSKAMDRDVILVPMSMSDRKTVDNTLYFSAAPAIPQQHVAGVGLVAGLLCLVLIGVRLVRQRGWTRAVGVVCLTVACAVFAMI